MRHGGMYIFIGIVIVLVLLTSYKVWQLTQFRKWVSLSTAVLIFAVMIGWQFLYRSEAARLPAWLWILAWTGSILMGLWATFILFSLPIDIVWGLTSRAVVNPHRRLFFTRLLPMGILGASGLITSLGLRQAVQGPEVKNVDISIPDLPAELSGMTIAQISDLHVSPLIQREYVENVVSKVLALNADLIAFTGDFADGTPEGLSDYVEPLRRLSAPLGKYFITGNHEYYWGAERWLEKARSLGFTTLVNENKILEHKKTKFLLGGVTDTSGGQFIESHKSDPKLAAQTAEPVAFKILLAHRPESYSAAEAAGFQVQLSGHTHAGQFFPFAFLMPLAHPFYRGLHKHGKLHLYVNKGTGYWGPPHRFGIPSEITLVRLVSS